MLQHEVDICRKEQPFVIRPPRSDSTSTMDTQPPSPSTIAPSPPSPQPSTSPCTSPSHTGELTMDMDSSLTGVNQGASTSAEVPPIYLEVPAKGPNGKRTFFFHVCCAVILWVYLNGNGTDARQQHVSKEDIYTARKLKWCFLQDQNNMFVSFLQGSKLRFRHLAGLVLNSYCKFVS